MTFPSVLDKTNTAKDSQLYGRYAVSEEIYEAYSPQTVERLRILKDKITELRSHKNAKNTYYKVIHHSKHNLSRPRQTSQEEVEAWKSFFYDLKERSEVNKEAFHNAQKIWCVLEQKYNVEIPICVAEDNIIFEWSFADLRFLIEFDADSIWWFFKKANDTSESVDEEVSSVDDLLKSRLFLEYVRFIENKNYPKA